MGLCAIYYNTSLWSCPLSYVTNHKNIKTSVDGTKRLCKIFMLFYIIPMMMALSIFHSIERLVVLIVHVFFLFWCKQMSTLFEISIFILRILLFCYSFQCSFHDFHFRLELCLLLLLFNVKVRKSFIEKLFEHREINRAIAFFTRDENLHTANT